MPVQHHPSDSSTGETAASRRPSPDDALVRATYLEGLLFDGDGHVRCGERAGELLDALNDSRRRLGWLPLDLAHHHCWP